MRLAGKDCFGGSVMWVGRGWICSIAVMAIGLLQYMASETEVGFVCSFGDVVVI
jgi:hypothetical protein